MFITPAEIRDRTTFDEIKALSDGEIEGYIERADSWIRRATNRDFSDTDDLFIQQDMETATWLMVEYLWFWDHPELREEAMSNDQIIKLGSYSVTRENPITKERAKPGELTGIEELDTILKYYRFRPSTGSLFRVLRKD